MATRTAQPMAVSSPNQPPRSPPLSTNAPRKNPILQFQDEIDAMSKTRRHSTGKDATSAAATAKAGEKDMVEGVERIQLGEDGETEEGPNEEKAPTIRERIHEAAASIATAAANGGPTIPPTKAVPQVQGSESPALVTSLAALFSRQMDVGHGETMVYLGPHNLDDRSLSSLFESDEGAPGVGANVLGLTKDEHLKAVQVVSLAAKEAGAEASVIWAGFDDEGRPRALPIEKEGTSGTAAVNDEEALRRWVARSTRLMIRRIPSTAQDLIELRVACVGNVDAGKSTILGVLTKGRLDDGRGRARVSLFRHKHELETGRTSSVGMEIMGFDTRGREVLPEGALAALNDKAAATTTDTDGNPATATAAASGIDLDYANSLQPGLRKQQLSWDEICRRAAKVVSFIDLAGHERYLKTTIFGLSGCAPDFVLLVIGANAGLIGMSKEHLSVALALSVPVVCVVTKVDMTPRPVLEQTIKQLGKILRSPGCRKTPVFVKDGGMASELARGFVKERACPIFLVSNVTGEGLAPLKTFLNTLPAGVDGRYPVDEPLEFSISDVFSVPFVGTVVSGVMLSGRISTGDPVLLGPDSLGHFVPTAVKSIQRKRVNVDAAEAGQSVSFSLKRIRRNGVRKGMVLLGKSDGSTPPPKAVKTFEGQILVLYHNSTISPGYQAMLHVGSVRQTVKILSIDKSKSLRTGDRATVGFEFIKSPEFLRESQRFLFREGKTKGLGVITKVGP